MGTIKIKNRTTLADFSATFRAALYLSGDKEQAEEGGFQIKVRENGAGKTVTVTEGDGDGRPRDDLHEAVMKRRRKKS